MPPSPITYACDRFPCLTQTFTRDEVRALRREGLLREVVALHGPGPEDPPADPALDGPVRVLERPWHPRVLGSLLAAFARHPLRVLGLLLAVLTPRSDPFRLGLVLRGPLHLAWGAHVARSLGPGDHVHAQFLTSASTVAWVASRLSGATFSFTAHSEWGMPLLRRKLRDATLGLCVSAHEKGRLLRRVPEADPGRLVVAPVGTPLADAPAEDRGGRGPGSDAPSRLACVATFGPTKGQDVLVRACALLAEEGVDVEVAFVGSGPLRGAAEQLARELGVAGRCTFHGALPHPRALEVVRGADAFVLPCRRTPSDDVDGVPVVLMEAMALGVPVVSTTVGGIPELVADGVDGRLVAPEDPRALADAIAALAGDAALRARLGEAGRASVRERRSAAACARRSAELLRAAASRGPGPVRAAGSVGARAGEGAS